MKKLVFMFAAVVAMSFASCGNKTAEAPATADSATADTTVAPACCDSTADSIKTDSVKADSVKTDSAAAPVK